MRLPITALVSLAFTATAAAQLVVGNDQSGVATIYNVDVTTGVATPIYSASDNTAKPWGMAFDHTTNTLYWNNGSVLYKSPMGPTLTPTTVGTMMFNAATINFVGLAYKNGKLWGTRNIATEAVYSIDIATLQATQVYVHPSTFDFGGLDVDATNGKLYGLSDTAPAGSVRGLYFIDEVNFSTTFIAGYPGAETDIDGLAVHGGKAYYVTDGPNTTQQFFYVYDIATGTLINTLPSPFTGSGTFSAAAFVPEPATIALAAMGLLAARRRR